jgi:hypothetical protein
LTTETARQRDRNSAARAIPAKTGIRRGRECRRAPARRVCFSYARSLTGSLVNFNPVE